MYSRKFQQWNKFLTWKLFPFHMDNKTIDAFNKTKKKDFNGKNGMDQN